MDKETKEYIDSFITIVNKLMTVMKTLIIGLVLTICIMAIVLGISVSYSQESSNKAMTEWFRLYMVTDYEYPSISQSIEQEIN